MVSIWNNCLKITNSELDNFVTFAGHVNHEWEKFLFWTWTEDQFKCLIFIDGVQSPNHTDLCTELSTKLEQEKYNCESYHCRQQKDFEIFEKKRFNKCSMTTSKFIYNLQRPSKRKVFTRVKENCDWHYSHSCPYKKYKKKPIYVWYITNVYTQKNPKTFVISRKLNVPILLQGKSVNKPHHKRSNSHSVFSTFKDEFEFRWKYISVSINKIRVRFQFDTTSRN